MRLSCLLALTIPLAAASALPAQADQAPKAAPAKAPAGFEPAPVRVWNRTITVFRAPYDQYTPAQRAEMAAERLEAIPEVGDWKIEAKATTIGEYSGMLVTVDGHIAFGLLPGDVDAEAGQTLKQATDASVARLGEFLEARAAQRSWPLLLRGIGLALGATLLFVLASTMLVYLRRRLLKWVERIQADPGKGWWIAGVNIQPQLAAVEQGAIQLGTWLLELALAYVWVTYVLMQFPYSQPWGQHLGGYLADLLQTLALGALGAIPGIFTVLLIFWLTRFFARLIGGFFQGVEEGRLLVPWLQAETARATRRLVIVLIWVFALVIAYPYIPGSNTDAFKGISVFLGLMVSLGSAGLVNQVMSGLVVVYARAFQTGDYVRVGETEGLVAEIGVLSTKIVTPKREEITIPNAVLVGTTTVNYSRLAGLEGSIVPTSVTIGYDTPWRQVHALLLLAAERTAGVHKEPRPRVMQKQLADFFVEYVLLVHIDRPERRVAVLSDLHAQIQDAFNEFGVQIMSPHFEAQPDRRIFVPRSEWQAPPAAEPGPPAATLPNGPAATSVG